MSGMEFGRTDLVPPLVWSTITVVGGLPMNTIWFGRRNSRQLGSNVFQATVYASLGFHGGHRHAAAAAATRPASKD
jgi:hypothetical protein